MITAEMIVIAMVTMTVMITMETAEAIEKAK